MDTEEVDMDKSPENKQNFKTPVLIGKVGRMPHKIFMKGTDLKTVPTQSTEEDLETKETQQPPVVESPVLPIKTPADLAQKVVPIPYKEPTWSGLPDTSGKKYAFDVLKSGAIIERLDLMMKPFWVFGRLPNCDVYMAHPTISRHHAVLQYRSQATEKEPAGFYLYDLNSTHGTFLNKNRLKSRVYVRVQVGHMLKLGCSSRTYILDGPVDDTEEVSELSVTELKAKRAEEILKKEETKKAKILAEEVALAQKKKKEEERGTDWGMGDDADEETDLTENPYAQTNNEELYIDDPKKALRGFMEREGLNFEYDCSEQGMGQFFCKVELPLDDEKGRPIIAEVLHKGKKKEAVIQCALEACRILDRHGILRQANHESRKRKTKNWEEDDFYDSDDDTYLDRTGTIEQKRNNRMKTKIPQQAETYQSLSEKEAKISGEIARIESQLSKAKTDAVASETTGGDEDSLDSYMKQLKHDKPDKQLISRLKLELTRLKQEHSQVLKMVNVARPANLPPLVPQYSQSTSTGSTSKNKFPMFGKRLKIKVDIPKPVVKMDIDEDDDEDDDDEDSDEVKSTETVDLLKQGTSKENLETESDKTEVEKKYVNLQSTEESSSIVVVEETTTNTSTESADLNVDSGNLLRNIDRRTTFYAVREDDLANDYLIECKSIEKEICTLIPYLSLETMQSLRKIWTTLKKLSIDEDRINIDVKAITMKKKKIISYLMELMERFDPKLDHKISSEVERIFTDLDRLGDEKDKIAMQANAIGKQLIAIAKELLKKKGSSDASIDRDKEGECSSRDVQIVGDDKLEGKKDETGEKGKRRDEMEEGESTSGDGKKKGKRRDEMEGGESTNGDSGKKEKRRDEMEEGESTSGDSGKKEKRGGEMEEGGSTSGDIGKKGKSRVEIEGGESTSGESGKKGKRRDEMEGESTSGDSGKKGKRRDEIKEGESKSGDSGMKDNKEEEEVSTSEDVEKKKKKNDRRLQQRQERLESERQRGYEEDAQRDDYNMWVPPKNQSGDGRTSLNDKLGY